MNQSSPQSALSPRWIEREKYLEAFEAARETDATADLGAFVPPVGHPLRLAVLEELIRIDLEQHWRRGEQRWLEDYVNQFPELLEASATLRTLAFEEFRLRRGAGQSPTTEEYRLRFGIDPSRAIRDDRLDLVPGPKTPPPTVDRFAQVMAALPRVGDQLLDYRLLAELGAGAYGRAFLAERHGRRVAIKVGPCFGAEPLTRLNHPNIVPVEEVFLVGAFRIVVMPYLGGVTLAHVLKTVASLPEPPIRGAVLFENSRPELPAGDVPDSDAVLRPALEAVYYADAVVWLAVQMASGLAHAHAQGIVHLDLKPANVLLTSAGRPMLLDFHPAESDQGLPAGGTLPYMAPEQIEAFSGRARKVDARADLFALGVLLYQFFTGRLPYPTATVALPASIDQALADRRGPTPDPMIHNRAVPPSAAAVVQRLLQPNPADRYPSASALLVELRRILGDAPLPMPPGPGWIGRLIRPWIDRLA